MRIHNLHRRVIRDMDMMLDGVNEILPVKMPKRYENQRLSLVPLLARLNKVTTPYNVYNEIHDDVTIPRGMCATSGLWYPEDMLPEGGSDADIRVIWHPHPNGHRIKITPTSWSRRRYFFWERLAHELVHRYQALDRPENQSTRTFKVRSAEDDKHLEQQEYYSDYDELEAYAHDAALEFLTWWPHATYQQAIKLAAQTNEDTPVWATYQNYLSTFEVGHPARYHFRRKVKQWYQTMIETRDFYDKLALPQLIC